MIDWLREITKSAETKRQERITAYVDGQLSAAEVVQIEAELETDLALKAEVEALRQLKAGIRLLPRQRAPRNFTLDPAVFGKPEPAYDTQYYPVLRVATGLAAFMFMLVVVLSLLNGGVGQEMATSAPDAANETALSIEATVVESGEVAAEPAMEDAAEMVEEEAMDEEVMEEEAMAEEESIDDADDAMADDPAMMEESAEEVDAEVVEESVTEEEGVQRSAPEAEPPADEAADGDVGMASSAVAEDAPDSLPTATPAPDSLPTATPAPAPTQAPTVVAQQAAEPTEEFKSEPLLPELTVATELDNSTTDEDSAESTTLSYENLTETTVETNNFSDPNQTSLTGWQIAIIGFGLLLLVLLLLTLWVRHRL